MMRRKYNLGRALALLIALLLALPTFALAEEPMEEIVAMADAFDVGEEDQPAEAVELTAEEDEAEATGPEDGIDVDAYVDADAPVEEAVPLQPGEGVDVDASEDEAAEALTLDLAEALEDGAADDILADEPTEEPPEEPVTEEPAGQPAEETGEAEQAQQPADEAGDEDSIGQPAEEADEEAPAEQPAEESGEEAPAGQPAEETGEEEQAQQPAEESGEEAPAGQPTDEAAAEEADGSDPAGEEAEQPPVVEDAAEEAAEGEPSVAEAPGEATAYDLWVGSVQVTSENKSGACDEGGSWSFSGDASGGTLTLTNASITTYNKDANIYSYPNPNNSFALTIVLEGTSSLSGAIYGIRRNGDLTIQSTSGGSVTITAESTGIEADGDLTISSCVVDAHSGENCIWANSNLTISGAATRVTAEGGRYGDYAIWCKTGTITLNDGLVVTDPYGAAPAPNMQDGGTGIYKGGVAQKEVTIAKPEPYPVWVDGVQVNSANKGDVLGDDSGVTYDPDSLTLTFPEKITLTKQEGHYSSAVIFAQDQDLNIAAPKGLVLNSSEARNGIVGKRIKVDAAGGLDITVKDFGFMTTGDVTVNGDVTITASQQGITYYGGAACNVTVNGNVTIKGVGDFGIHSEGAVTLTGDIDIQSNNQCCIYAEGDVSLKYGTCSLTSQSAYALEGANVTLEGDTFTAVTQERVDCLLVDKLTLKRGAFSFTGLMRAIQCIGDIEIQSGVTRVYGKCASTDYGVIVAYNGSIKLDKALHVTTPEGGHVDNEDYGQILDKDGYRVSEVVIEPIPTHTVTIDPSIAHGTVQADRDVAAEGVPVKLTVTPDPGHAVEAVTVNGAAITPVDGAYSFDMPGRDVIVSATFAELRTLSLSVEGTDGIDGIQIFTLEGAVIGSKSVYFMGPGGQTADLPLGKGVTLTAPDLDGCDFAGWVEDGAVISQEPVLIWTVDGDRSLLARYTQNQIMVRVDLDGREWQDDDAFTFTLSTDDEDAKWSMPPEGERTVTITKSTPDHAATFGKLWFTSWDAGYTYTYKVTLTSGSEGAWDAKEKTVTYSIAERAGGGTIDVKPSRLQTVTFTRARSTVALSPATLKLDMGRKATLTAAVQPEGEALVWESSDPKVATVTQKGVVKGVKKGTAVITVRTADGAASATCAVKVLVPTKLTLAKTARVKVKKSVKLKLTVKGGAGNPVLKVKSSNTKIATAKLSGGKLVVTGRKAGKVKVTVTTADGKVKAVCTVTVQSGSAGMIDMK